MLDLCPYQNFTQPVIKFCEENLCSNITQPANTWSNLIYIAIGIYFFIASRQTRSWFLKLFPIFPIIIGLTSFVYHATFTFTAELFDLGSMFLFATFLLIFNLKRLKPILTAAKLAVFYFLINILAFTLQYFVRVIPGLNFNIGVVIFAILILSVVVTELLIYQKSNRSYRLYNLWWAFGLLIFATIPWYLDLSKIWCSATTSHIINGHVVWHIITAIAFIFIYKFYKQFDIKTSQ